MGTTSRFVMVVGAAIAIASPPLAAHAAMPLGPMFTPPDRIAVGGGEVTVLDFDGDGWPDIATVHERTVNLVRGLPDGWAAPQTVTLPGSGPTAVTRITGADLSGDGRDELIVAIPDAQEIAVLRGRADGMLTGPEPGDIYAVPPPGGAYGDAFSIDVGDLNGDGSLDVVAGLRSGSTVDSGMLATLVNDGTGALTLTSRSIADPEDVRLARMTGDDDPDLLIAQRYGGPAYSTPPGKLGVMLGGAGATFGALDQFSAGPGMAYQVAAADLDDDGAQDVLVGLQGNAPPYPPPYVLMGDASSPTLGTAVPVVSDVPVSGSDIGLGDVDHDGRADIALASAYGVGFLLNSGDGVHYSAAGGPSISNSLWGWTLADADGDGKLDVVTASNDEVSVFYGAGPLLVSWLPHGEDFGSVDLGQSSTPLDMAVINDGPGPATGLQVLADGDVSDFPIETNGCSGQSLALFATCSIWARFTPTAVGDRELDLAVVAPDSDQAFWMSFFGTGTTPPPQTATTTTTTTPPPPPIGPARPLLTRAAAPKLSGSGRRLKLDTGWIVNCPGTGPGCRVTVLLVARARGGHRAPVLARASLVVRAGSRRRLIVPVTATGRRTLRPGRTVRALLSLAATRSGAVTVTAQRNVALRVRRHR